MTMDTPAPDTTNTPSRPAPVARPERQSPRPTLARSIVYWFCWYLSLGLLTIFFRMRRFHTERIPRSGAVILAGNHLSHFDPPLLSLSVTTRPTHFVARLGLFKFKPFGWLISALNSIPIREEEGDIAAIKATLARLEDGHPVILFPEGSRSFDGVQQPFKRGVALLLKRAKCPVVPMAVEGCYEAFPRTRKFPRFWGTRIAVLAGFPIPHEELLKDGPDAALRRLATEIETLRLELRSKMRASTGGRYPPPGPADERAEPQTA
jgi:1-acyl-sn-glycerol-3-phosphate acyltransferase